MLIIFAFTIIIILLIVHLMLTIQADFPNINCTSYGCLLESNYYLHLFTNEVELIINLFVFALGLWFYVIYKRKGKKCISKEKVSCCLKCV